MFPGYNFSYFESSGGYGHAFDNATAMLGYAGKRFCSLLADFLLSVLSIEKEGKDFGRSLVFLVW